MTKLAHQHAISAGGHKNTLQAAWKNTETANEYVDMGRIRSLCQMSLVWWIRAGYLFWEYARFSIPSCLQTP